MTSWGDARFWTRAKSELARRRVRVGAMVVQAPGAQILGMMDRRPGRVESLQDLVPDSPVVTQL